MEGLLRGPQLSEMIRYYPIRHHSPACARHLETVLAQYAPDCILVEGPENAQELIPLLTDPQTRPPVALYYACRDARGPEPVTYRCYYPFLDTSPELVALRYARERGIPGYFIDLSYGAMMLSRQTVAWEQGIAVDHYLFQERVCQRAGVRDFEEFWEKYFEAAELTADQYQTLMERYCRLVRQSTPREELLADGCLAREAHMAARIAAASRTWKRILVVAGGFHIPGLLESAEPDPGSAIPAGVTQSVYPMRYDLCAADALMGYASGMRSPGYYDSLWTRLHGDHPESAWEESILDYIAKTGRALRKRGYSLSVHDERCAYEMALGLAALREKDHPGLYELMDGVLASFVKDDQAEAMKLLAELTRGSRVGELAATAPLPPLQRDFEAQCKGFRLNPEGHRDAVLSILSDEKHRNISRFFHQTVFLGCGFAQRRRGPDLLKRRDRNLIRETWDYRWTPRVDRALIEHALDGATVREACEAGLHRAMAGAQRSDAGAELLLQGLMMGIGDNTGKLFGKMEDLLLNDGDFTDLAQACKSLYLLHQWQDQYGEGGRLDCRRLLNRCFDRVVLLLPSLYSVDDRSVGGVQEACTLLYELTLRPDFSRGRERFARALEILVSETSIHPALHGAALGLLYGMDRVWKASIDTVVRGYLRGSLKHHAAPFLQGLFSTARDLLLTEGDFLGHIDQLLGELEDEAFLQALPELRLAFSYFLPTETDRIAKSVASLHGVELKTIQTTGVHPDDYRQAARVDAWAAERLDRMGGDQNDRW